MLIEGEGGGGGGGGGGVGLLFEQPGRKSMNAVIRRNFFI
jgi:hypothetical protein